MTAWLIFAVGFAAGTCVNLRDIPLAATALGAVLVLAGLSLVGVKP